MGRNKDFTPGICFEGDEIEPVALLPAVPCAPNCCKNHQHRFEFNFAKSSKHALRERPGQKHLNLGGLLVPTYPDSLGSMQTPINLETNIPVLRDFKEKFEVKYEPIDAVTAKRFNEKGSQFLYQLNPSADFMLTKTAGLFDTHLKDREVKFHGMQAHFHSPSEHTIDGQLLDLELHIVHGIQSDLTPSMEGGSQFTNGVLGFLFKVVPDSYFKTNSDAHDRFLYKLAQDYKDGDYNSDMAFMRLDFTAFVKRLQYDKRWTYQGSLTTAPFGEGILWNVLEQVIPIRQQTLDELVAFKEIEDRQRFNRFESVDVEQKHYTDQIEAGVPAHCVPCACDRKTLFRTAICNRAVQDKGDRPVYRINV
jgi:carbonic anhydrase